MKKQFLSLRIKAIVAITVLIFSVALILSTFFIKQGTDIVHKELKKRGVILTKNFARNAKDSLINGINIVQLEQLAHEVASQSEVGYCLVSDLKGEVIVEKGLTDQLKNHPTFKQVSNDALFTKNVKIQQLIISEEKKYYDISVPVVKNALFLENLTAQKLEISQEALNNNIIGRVRIGLSLDQAARLVQQTRQTVNLISALIVFISIFVTIFMIRFVIVPIRKIVKATEDLAAGNLYCQVKVHTNDEIQDLANAFNKMIRDLKKSVVSIDSLKDEIDDRRKAQEALAISEKRFELAVRGSADGIWDLDMIKKELWISPYFKEILGYDDKLVGEENKNFEKIFHPDDLIKIKEDITRHINEDIPFDKEYQLKVKKGEYRWFRIRGQVLKNDEGQPVRMAGSLRDVTERIQANEKLRAIANELKEERKMAMILAEEAQSASKAKGDFLANMSHEIRTPMNAILGFGDILSMTELTSEQRHFVKTIQSSGELLINLINDILDFSKLEAGKVDLENIDFDLNYLIKDVFNIIRTKIEGKPVNPYFQIQEDVPFNLKGDPTRIRQILINLLSNALKFTNEGEIGVEISVDEELENEYRLRFTVRDTGIGIEQDKAELIFESFSQADTSTTRKFGGTGLGLAICKSLVQAMKGKIWVESQVGKGSKFIFQIQLEKSTANYNKDIVPLSLGQLKNKKVMIVDDNQRSREILKKYSEDLGLNVIASADSVQGALQKLDQLNDNGDAPQLILNDIMMPVMDGYDLIKRVRQNDKFKSIKLIAVSSDVHVGISNQMNNVGFDGFLAKPVIREELNKVISAVLGDQREEKQVITRHTVEELSCEGVKVLVVEDNFANQELMKVYLQKLGCKEDIANNGQEAVDILKETPNDYDLILMDMQMPVMGGDEATQIIKHTLKLTIPIVALTAAAMKTDQQKCLDAGMDDYLTKPVNVDKLREVIIQYTTTK